MKNKYLNNIIISIFILSIILSPYVAYVQSVEAQVKTSSKKGITLSSLQQCNDVSIGTKILFAGTIGTLSSLLEGSNIGYSVGQGLGTTLGGLGVDYLKDQIGLGTEKILSDTLGDKVKDVVGITDSVNVNIEGTKSAREIKAIAERTKNTEEKVTKIADQSTCVAAVGRIITKMLLQKLTLSTVNWIKSGFEGSPTFIQNPGKFFKDLAKTEVLQFGSEVTMSGNPFGKEWLKNTASAFNNKFQENARYSLDEMIKNTTPEYSSSEFELDFSKGGWNAWNAMTQVPANNPIGFKMMADIELEKKLAGTSQSTGEMFHEALSQANGFLGDQRCADPKGVTKEEHQKGLIERANHPTKKEYSYNYDLITGILTDSIPVYKNRICNKWEYVTPGIMIAEAATGTMNTTKDSLLAVEDLNDSIAAITDALLAQFSSNVMEKGFAELDEKELSGSLNFDTNSSSTQASKDFSPSQLSNSWLSNNPTFNIRTDLTQALIDEQRTYVNKLIAQNKALISTKDGKEYKLDNTTGESNADGLIPTIYQLDYCIPGPHPDWENDAREALKERTDKILSKTTESMESDSFVSGFLTGIPIIGSLIDNASRKRAQAKVRAYYGWQITDITGVFADSNNTGDKSSYLASAQGATAIINAVFNEYVKVVNNSYNKKLLPTSTTESVTNFRKISGYKQMVFENEEKIASLNSIIKVLENIKENIDNLNLKYPDGGDEYESELKYKINEFGRISSEMVNGTDIAEIDNLTKEINDEKLHIYEYLLKGEYGCEKELETNTNNMDQTIYNTKRIEYPFPILYDYITGKNIPDPMKIMKTTNKFNIKNNPGPGFLPFKITQIDLANFMPTSGGRNLNGNVFETVLKGKKSNLPMISEIKNGQQFIPNDEIKPGLY